MNNEIDILMDLDPLDLSAQNIDAIILQHRKWRKDFEAGVKPAKKKEVGAKLDITSLVQNITKKTDDEPKMNRRKL